MDESPHLAALSTILPSIEIASAMCRDPRYQDDLQPSVVGARAGLIRPWPFEPSSHEDSRDKPRAGLVGEEMLPLNLAPSKKLPTSLDAGTHLLAA